MYNLLYIVLWMNEIFNMFKQILCNEEPESPIWLETCLDNIDLE